MLFLEGFSNTKTLSKKVDILYKLAVQQLSKQDHYDFGLRALTTALKTAGIRKRSDATLPEDSLLFAALRDSNLPKLTTSDTPLFMGILTDLFVGVELITVNNSEFKNALFQEITVSHQFNYQGCQFATC